MSKRRYEGEQTKKNILDHARILFSQRGYAATSIEDIRTTSGCSKGSIYYHFGNKEDLFLYLVEQTLAEMSDEWIKISFQYESATEKLYAMADWYVYNFQRPLTRAVEELISSVGEETETAKKLIAAFTVAVDNCEKLVSEGIARGEFKGVNPRRLAYIIFSFHVGLSGSYRVMDKEAMKDLYQEATTLLLQGIGTRNET